jgi:hypothetical protein
VKRFVSLEDDLGITAGASASAYSVVVPLTVSDKQTRSCAAALRRNQETLVSLEAMRNYLDKQDPKQIGPVGVSFANIAIENLCSANRISLESLTVNPVDYDQNPQAAVAQGLASMDKTQQELVDRIHGNLTEILRSLCDKRDALNRTIGSLWKEVTRLDNMDPVSSPENIQLWQGAHNLFYLNGSVPGFDPLASRVIGDLCHFLTEHTHLFKRLIQKQLNWINDHKDNLLKGRSGFDQYTFNPVEYRCNGSVPADTHHGVAPEGQVAYRSVELPGMKAFYMLTNGRALSGIEAIEALSEATTTLTWYNDSEMRALLSRYNGPAFTETGADAQAAEELADKLRQIPALDGENCKARIQEVKRALRDLEHWADMAYVKMWKDAYFEQEVLSALLKATAGSIGERGLSLLAQSVASQLVQAASHVDSYAVDTIREVLRYVALSMGTEIEE